MCSGCIIYCAGPTSSVYVLQKGKVGIEGAEHTPSIGGIGRRLQIIETLGGRKDDSSLCTFDAIFSHQRLMYVSRSAPCLSLPLRLC